MWGASWLQIQNIRFLIMWCQTSLSSEGRCEGQRQWWLRGPFVNHTSAFDYCFTIKEEWLFWAHNRGCGWDMAHPHFRWLGNTTLRLTLTPKKSQNQLKSQRDSSVFNIAWNESWWHLFRLALKGNHSIVTPSCLEESWWPCQQSD